MECHKGFANISSRSRAAHLFQLSFCHQLVLGRLQLLLHRPKDLLQVEPGHSVQQVLHGLIPKGGPGRLPCSGGSHAVNGPAGEAGGTAAAPPPPLPRSPRVAQPPPPALREPQARTTPSARRFQTRAGVPPCPPSITYRPRPPRPARAPAARASPTAPAPRAPAAPALPRNRAPPSCTRPLPLRPAPPRRGRPGNGVAAPRVERPPRAATPP